MTSGDIVQAVRRCLPAALAVAVLLGQGSAAAGDCAPVWQQVNELTASGGQAHDQIGASVAISGDSIVVGTWYRGAAYVFARDQGGANQWGQVAALSSGAGAVEDYFGASVAISGDTIVVSAEGHQENRGAAYVFGRDQGGANRWGQVAELTAGDGAAEDYFGGCVAISGDTIVVAAEGHQVGKNEQQGAVYVFGRDQGGANRWGQVAELSAGDGAEGDYFGAPAAISGDTVVVAAEEHLLGNGQRGAAFVFGRNEGGANQWGQVKELSAGDGAEGDGFGAPVAISGDTIVVAGEKQVAGSGDFQGAVHVFARNQGGANQWGRVAELTAGDGAAGDYFGAAVATSGDSIIVGAPLHQVGSNEFQGAVYVFAGDQAGANPWGRVQELSPSDGAANDGFGISAAISGDTFVAGAWGHRVGGNVEQGAAYVYQKRAASCLWLPQVTRR